MLPVSLKSRRRRVLWILAGAVALVLGITTCRTVTDNVLGAHRGADPTETCISDCAHTANDAIRAESDLHVANVHACSGDVDCLAREEARHEAAVAAIQAQRQKCQDDCKHQGGGSGGR